MKNNKTFLALSKLLLVTIIYVISASFLASFESHSASGFASQEKTKEFTDIATLIKAAEQGDSKSQLQLAKVYLVGRGVRENTAEAIKWLLKAADQDNVDAELTLGAMYAAGQGVIKNDAESVKWHRKAAEQGDSRGQVVLGSMYARGLGVAQDYVQAYMWTALAADSMADYEQLMAEQAREKLAKEMTPEQIAEAQRLASEWKSKRGQTPPIFNGPPKVAPPVPVIQTQSPFTEEARKAGVKGEVLVQCIIRKDGTANSCKVLKRLGFGLDESAIKTITTKWRFQPGSVLGKPVDMQGNISVKFR